QAEDGIRDRNVTGVQTCALPICRLLLQRGIKVFSSKTLIDSSYAPFKRVIFFIAEQRTVFSEFHAVDYFSAFLICQSVSFSGSRSEERRVGKECRQSW